MDAQHTPAALDQHREIALRLRGLDHAEAVAMAGNIDVDRIVTSDLQEYAGIRPTLVGLPG